MQQNTSSHPVGVQELLAAGAHFGHVKSKWNPKMSPFIFGVRNGFHIIDLVKSSQMLADAAEFLGNAAKNGKIILFVGTKTNYKGLLREIAVPLNVPYVADRWVGGTLTNFDHIAKRLEYFKTLRAKRQTGELDKYTKYERQQFEKELSSLERTWGGIKDLTRKPDVMVILDPRHDDTAFAEARVCNIPVVGVVNTDADPSHITYPIPANNDSIKTQRIILEILSSAIRESRKAQKPAVSADVAATAAVAPETVQH